MRYQIRVLVSFVVLAALLSARPLLGQSRWGANYFPNVTLINQDGKQVRFYDDLLKGKIVAIYLFYTHCVDACPLETARMIQVQKMLGDRVGKDIFFYALSIDPKRDTPEVLKAYAARFHAGPGWLFLTGKREDIDVIRYRLGERGAKEGHGNTVRLGNVAASQWMKLPLEADVNYLVNEVGKMLVPNWYAGQQLKTIDEAPRMEITGSQREQLIGQAPYRGRCASCHTLGAGDRIGPDLKDVTVRRTRDWLARYLPAPDRMLASKDPIAVELAKRHKVPMPNLNLTHDQIDELIAYMELQVSHPAAATVATKGEVHKH